MSEWHEAEVKISVAQDAGIVSVGTPGFINSEFPGYAVAKNFQMGTWGIVHIDSKLKAGGLFKTPGLAMKFIEQYQNLPDFTRSVEDLKESGFDPAKFGEEIYKASDVGEPGIETCAECNEEVAEYAELGYKFFCRACLEWALEQC